MDFKPEWGLTRSQTKPKIRGTVPTDQHETIPNDYGTISACFDGDPKLPNCEIAQPSDGEGKLSERSSEHDMKVKRIRNTLSVHKPPVLGLRENV